jgi:hypothetical protein
MVNNIPISDNSKIILYKYPQIKKRNDMSYTELRIYTDDWQTFDRVWMYNYTVRDLLKTGANVSYYAYESVAERRSYRAGQASHVSMYPDDAAKGVFNDIQHTIPDTPTWNTVVGKNASAELTWNIPPSNESPIISYTITAYDVSNNTITQITPGSTNFSIFTGLTNGLSYTFRIFSTNDIGNSPISDYSNSVIPKTSPSQPTGFSIFQANSYFNVRWIVPYNGGSVITSYILTLRDANNNTMYDLGGNPIQNIITNTDLSGAAVLNTREGLLIITDSNKTFFPYAIGQPIQSYLQLGTSYSFTVSAKNASGESDITILKSPVRFIQTPRNPPVWVNIVYNVSQDKLTFTFTQKLQDYSMTTSYKFTSSPVAVDRTVSIQNTTATSGYDSNGNSIYTIVASILGIPDNTYTFKVYASNIANNDSNPVYTSESSTPSTVISKNVSNV